MKKLFRPLGLLLLLILVCAVIARVTNGSETLSEYAEKNISAASSKTPEAAPSEAAVSTAASKPETGSSVSAPSSEPEPGAFMTAGAKSDGPDDFVPAASETGESIHYKDGFFYQSLTPSVTGKITGFSYPVSETLAPALSSIVINIIPDEETPAVALDDLRYLNVLYYDFNGKVQTGELICHKEIAQDLVEIFYELYLNEYQIEKIRLIDEYGADDTASMADNNTSCFNYRVVDGTDSLSKHALGCAIDINPFYNPYVVFNKDGSGETYISPKGSEIYADRSKDFAYKIDESDLCYQLFTAHGFTWGGHWNSCKDYQHFQKVVEIPNEQSSIFNSLTISDEAAVTADMDVYLNSTEASFLFVEVSEDTEAVMHYTYTTKGKDGVSLGYYLDGEAAQTVSSLSSAEDENFNTDWTDQAVTLKKGTNIFFLTGSDASVKMHFELTELTKSNVTYVGAQTREQAQKLVKEKFKKE